MTKVLFTEVMFIIAIAICVFWYLGYLWSRRKLYSYCRKMQGPISLPFIGSSYIFLRGSLEDIFQPLNSLFNIYPGIAKFWHAQELMFLISDPEIAQTVLTSPKAYAKSKLYRFFEEGLGHGLFTAPVPKWKKSRKLLAPTFGKQILYGFRPVHIEHGQKLTEEIDEILNRNEKLDIYLVVKRTVLNVLCETIMDIKLSSQGGDEFSFHVDTLRCTGYTRVIKILYQNDFIFSFTKEYKESRKSLNYMNNFIKNVIDEQYSVYNNNKENASLEAPIDEGTKHRSFLQCFLEFPVEGISKQDMQDEIFTFLGAGSDTTTNTICFALLLLAMHPIIQNKVYNEIIDILGTEREMLPEDIDQFVYTEQTIKETLRLFPAGPFIGRTLEADLEIKDGEVLPEGCTIIVGIFAIQRNEKYWKNPLKFDPDRFLPQNFAKQHPCTFMPFSYGPRNCIANKFAMISSKVFVAHIVRRFHLKTSYKTVEDVETFAGTILEPKYGFQLELIPRIY